MRAYEIALFTFLFTFMLAMVQQLGIMEASVTMSQGWNESDFSAAYSGLNSSMESASKQVQESVPNYFFESIKLTIEGFRAFATALVGSTVFVPELFRNIMSGLGMPATEAALIGYPLGVMVWFVYVIGMIQLALGRSLRDAE